MFYGHDQPIITTAVSLLGTAIKTEMAVLIGHRRAHGAVTDDFSGVSVEFFLRGVHLGTTASGQCAVPILTPRDNDP